MESCRAVTIEKAMNTSMKNTLLGACCLIAGTSLAFASHFEIFKNYIPISKIFILALSLIMSVSVSLEGETVLAAAYLMIAAVNMPFALGPITSEIAAEILSSVVMFLSSANLFFRGSLPRIRERDMEILRKEFQKAESLQLQAEEEIRKAQAQKEEALALAKKAQERLGEKRVEDRRRMPSPLEIAYEELGIHETDSDEVAHDIYLKLAGIYHPDRFARSGELSHRQKNLRLASINAAYDIIMRNRKNKC